MIEEARGVEARTARRAPFPTPAPKSAQVARRSGVPEIGSPPGAGRSGTRRGGSVSVRGVRERARPRGSRRAARPTRGCDRQRLRRTAAGTGTSSRSVLSGVVSVVLSLGFAAGAAAGPRGLASEACDPAGEDGTTALMRAAFAGADEEVVRLLDGGADPNARCHADGTTALRMVFAPLFADPDGSDWELPETPLSLPEGVGTEADRGARGRSLDALLSAGADPNARERDTHPLTLAVMLQAVWAVEALLAGGADPALAPNLEQAVRMIGDPEIAALLGIE